MPHVRLMHAYGMTEAAPIVTLLDPRYTTLDGPYRRPLKSCGQAALGCEIKVVDADRKEVPRGTAGELAIRGANIMKGYWNKPAETAAVLEDGWYYSGDGATMDEEGFVFIVDRLKDMIISGGENVYSAEVENAISLMPGVGEVAVIGVPDERWGERVHAIIVPKRGANLTAEAVIEHCRAPDRRLQVPAQRRLPRHAAAALRRRQGAEARAARALLEGLHQGGELSGRLFRTAAPCCAGRREIERNSGQTRPPGMQGIRARNS